MKKGFIKEFILIGFSFVLIIVGYMNYNPNVTEETIAEAEIDENRLGDVELVSSINSESLNNEIIENAIENRVNEHVAKTSNDYFSNSKIDRENMYSQTIETYEKMINSNEISSEQKSIAINEIKNIKDIQNKIMICENLILNKGFENVLILVNGENINVVIRKAVLSKEDVAQIQNIISREMNTEIDKISITTK